MSFTKDPKPGFERLHLVHLPFDLRSDDPVKNHGIGGLRVWFVLRGPKGAVQYAVMLPCYLPHVVRENPKLVAPDSYHDGAMGLDVGYHSPVPRYEGQQIQEQECPQLGGTPCYYDGSSLNAEDWTKEIFTLRGAPLEPLIWAKLHEYYDYMFEEQPWKVESTPKSETSAR